MNLTDIGTSLREDLEQGQAWVARVLNHHVPALLAEGDRIAQSPIVEALASVVLPPETEHAIAALILKFGAAYRQGPPAPAIPATLPASPTEPTATAATPS